MGRVPHKIILDCDPGHDDAIAIMLAYGNPEIDLLAITHRRTSGVVAEPVCVADVNSGRLCRLDQEAAVGVVAHGADEPHPRSEDGRGDRLVGALAARRGDELRAGHGLARRGKPFGSNGQVNVERALRGPRCRAAEGSTRSSPDVGLGTSAGQWPTGASAAGAWASACSGRGIRNEVARATARISSPATRAPWYPAVPLPSAGERAVLTAKITAKLRPAPG